MPNTPSTNKRLVGAAKAAAIAAAEKSTNLAAAIAAGPQLPQDDPMNIPTETLEELGELAPLTDDDYLDEDTELDSLPSDEEFEVELEGLDAGDGDEEMVEGYEYDSAKDDYVKIVRPASHWIQATSDELEPDGLDISNKYHDGEGSDFDYRWIPRDSKRQHFDRSNGFVPVKKLQDNRYRLENGVVTNGDLVLARRPKQVTEQRAQAQADLAARLSGEADGFRAGAAKNGTEIFGEIEVGGEKIHADRIHPEELHDRLERDRKGTKSYAINVPWQRDKVAERHRAAVGG